jgi:hypothetical protein
MRFIIANAAAAVVDATCRGPLVGQHPRTQRIRHVKKVLQLRIRVVGGGDALQASQYRQAAFPQDPLSARLKRTHHRRERNIELVVQQQTLRVGLAQHVRVRLPMVLPEGDPLSRHRPSTGDRRERVLDILGQRRDQPRDRGIRGRHPEQPRLGPQHPNITRGVTACDTTNAKSNTILPGSCTASGRCQARHRADNSFASPLRQAVSTNNTPPACDTSDSPPVITDNQERRPLSFTREVPLCTVDQGLEQLRSNRAEQALSRIRPPCVTPKINYGESPRLMTVGLVYPTGGTARCRSFHEGARGTTLSITSRYPFRARIGYLRLVAKGAANTMTSAETPADTSAETSTETSTTSAETSAEASADKIRGLVDQTLEEAEPLVDKVLERTESFVEEAKEKAELLAEKIKEKAEPLVEKVREKAEPLVEKAEGSSGKDSTS